MLAVFQVDTVVVALIVAVIAPSVVAIGNARIQSKNQEKVWQREDALEARREARENELHNQTQTSLDKLTNETKVIHALVNSELTKAYERDLASTVASRDALQKLIDLTKELNQEVHPDDISELADKEQRIKTLEKIISDRNTHQEKLDEAVSTKENDTP